MNIKTLSERIAIPVRKIRYVIDHDLVPESTWYVDEFTAGRARVFDESGAVFIACAAYLLNAGYKRDSVRELLSAVGKIMPTGRNPLGLPIMELFLTSQEAARVQFADGLYVRWLTAGGTGEWIDPANPKASQSHLVPKVVVDLNFSEIRDQVRGRKSPT